MKERQVRFYWLKRLVIFFQGCWYNWYQSLWKKRTLRSSAFTTTFWEFWVTYVSYCKCSYHCCSFRKLDTVVGNRMFREQKLHKAFLTSREPCIVIYSYNKSQRDALLLKFIPIKNSTCFGQIYCPSSGVSTLYTQQ